MYWCYSNLPMLILLGWFYDNLLLVFFLIFFQSLSRVWFVIFTTVFKLFCSRIEQNSTIAILRISAVTVLAYMHTALILTGRNPYDFYVFFRKSGSRNGEVWWSLGATGHSLWICSAICWYVHVLMLCGNANAFCPLVLLQIVLGFMFIFFRIDF